MKSRIPRTGKRVLFFDDRHYAAQGAQRLLIQLAGYARDRGLDVTVGSTKSGAMLDFASNRGLKTVVLGMPEELDEWGGELISRRGIDRLRLALALGKQNLAIARQVRAQKYDLVWAAAMRPMLSLLVTAFVLRVPVVWHIMGSGYFRGFSEMASLAATRIVLIANGLRPAVGLLASRYPIRARIRVVQTGLPAPTDVTDPREELRLRLHAPADVLDKWWVVSIGAHIPEKGHLDVVRAVEGLDPDVRSQVFLLIGGPPTAGEYHDALVRAAEDSNGSVIVRGWIDNVDEWLRAADIYVLASQREGMPLTLIEAMQRRAVPIGYPVGGVPEVIQHGRSGFLARLGCAEDISAAITSIVADPAQSETIAQEAQRSVLENNSASRMRTGFEAVLRDCLRPEVNEVEPK